MVVAADGGSNKDVDLDLEANGTNSPLEQESGNTLNGTKPSMVLDLLEISQEFVGAEGGSR